MLDPMGEERKYGSRPSGSSSESWKTARCDSFGGVKAEIEINTISYTSWAERLIYEQKTHMLSKYNCPMKLVSVIAMESYEDKISRTPERKKIVKPKTWPSHKPMRHWLRC